MQLSIITHRTQPGVPPLGRLFAGRVRLWAMSAWIVSALAAVPGPVHALECTWMGGTGNWSVATNWGGECAGAQVPHELADNVSITSGTVTQNMAGLSVGAVTVSGGSLALNQDVAAKSLSLSGGTLKGSGALTVSGTLAWSGGTMEGPGGTTANGPVTLSGSTKYLYRPLTIPSGQTVTWTAGDVYLTSGVVLSNSGTFDVQCDAWLSANGGGTFQNESGAVLRKRNSSGTTTVSVPLSNSGQVLIQSGVLDLRAGGINSGSFSGSAGTKLLLSSGNYTFDNASSISFPRVAFAGGIVAVEGSYTATESTTVSGGSFTFSGSSIAMQNSLILSAGTVSLNNAAMSIPLGTVDLSGGTLKGSSALTISGTLTWSGGTMEGPAGVTANGPVTLAGSSKYLYRPLTIPSGQTVTWTAGDVYLTSGVVLSNSGTFDVQSDAWLSANGGGTFQNESGGVLKKRNSSGTTTVSVALSNSGQVQVQSGTLDLRGGGISSSSYTGSAGTKLLLSSGNYTFDSDSSISFPRVAFAGGIVAVEGSYSATQSTTVSGGSFTFSGPTLAMQNSLTLSAGTVNLNNAAMSVPLGTVDFSGGTLKGSSALTISGTLTWSGGTMEGPAGVTANGPVILSGSAKYLYRPLTIPTGVTVTWTAGDVYLTSGVVLSNSGTFDVQCNAWLSANGGGTFQNEPGAVLRKRNSSGTTTVSVALSNSGEVQIQSGTLDLRGGGLSSSSVSGSAGTKLLLSSGNYTFDSASSISFPRVAFAGGIVGVEGSYTATQSTTVSGGSFTFSGPSVAMQNSLTLSGGTVHFDNAALSIPLGTVDFSGGTLKGSSALTINGTLTWSGGTMEGPGAVTADGPVILSGSAKYLYRPLTISSGQTVTWTAGDVYLTSGIVLSNSGTFDVQCDAWLYANGGGLFHNAGVFKKSAGVGISQVSVGFTNVGTVELKIGTVRFAGAIDSLLQTAGSTILNGGKLAGQAALKFQGGSLAGNGIIDGHINSTGVITPGLSPGSFTINGDLMLADGSDLTFEIGGRTAGTQHDFIDVNSMDQPNNGRVQLHGDLVVTLVDGFADSVTSSDVFTLLTADSAITGSFENAVNGGRLNTSDGAGSFQVHYGTGSASNPNHLILTDFGPPVAGPTPTGTPTGTATPTPTRTATATPTSTPTPTVTTPPQVGAMRPGTALLLGLAALLGGSFLVLRRRAKRV